MCVEFVSLLTGITGNVKVKKAHLVFCIDDIIFWSVFFFNLITIVLLNLLNILCLLLLVNINPRITSIGSKKDLPKLSIAAVLISILLSPDKSIVFIFKSLLPIDWPLVDSKYVQ